MAAIDYITRNSGAVLTVLFTVDGVPTAASGVVTVLVTTANGTILTGGGAGTDNASAGAGTGEYQWTLPAQANLNRLTLKWTGVFSGVTQSVETYAEIVGQQLFSIYEARNFGKQSLLADVAKYPSDDIIDVREEIAETFAKHCRVSFVPRFARETLDGGGTGTLYLPHARVSKLLYLSIGGTVIDVNTIDLWPDSLGYRSGLFTKDSRNIIAEYEHGYQLPPPEIVRAALVLAQSLLVGSDIMDRSVSHTDETGTYRLSYPDMQRDRPTGIPYVDATLHKYVELWGVA